MDKLHSANCAAAYWTLALEDVERLLLLNVRKRSPRMIQVQVVSSTRAAQTDIRASDCAILSPDLYRPLTLMAQYQSRYMVLGLL